ncbi:hypothetical protein J7J18_03635 [bacterium]|nr:hypothetical protein [bacterium]
MSSIAFKPEELKEAKKDFVGQIVAAEYGEAPLGMEGRPDIPRRKQLAIQIRTDEYEKDQFEWYPPSDKKLTKWAYFIEALAKTGALKDIRIEGSTDDERMQSFAKSLVGMKFRFVEYTDLPVIVKGKTIECILPEEYYGKSEVPKETEVKTEKVELG